MSKELYAKEPPKGLLFLESLPLVGDKIIEKDTGLTHLVIQDLRYEFRAISRLPGSRKIKETYYGRRPLSRKMPKLYVELLAEVHDSTSLDYLKYNEILTKAGL